MDEWFAVFVAMSRVLTRGASRWRLQRGLFTRLLFGRANACVSEWALRHTMSFELHRQWMTRTIFVLV